MDIFLGYIFSYSYLFGVIFLVGLLKKVIGFPLELSRKLIHVFICFTWVIMYRFLSGTWHFVVIPFTFVIINALSYKFKIFKMFEREGDENNHLGTVYYAISMTVMSIVSLFVEELLIPYGIAVFCLSFGDGAASIFGTFVKKNIKITKNKSLVGTIACIIFSALGILILSIFVKIDYPVWQLAIISVLCGIFELIGVKGTDNFTVPFGILLICYLFSLL